MSKLDDFVRMVKETISPDDIIVALLANIKANDIKKDPEFFHSAIYKLREDRQFEELLEDFEFDISGLSPFSELLDRVLFRLETACVLGTMNPSYECYRITDEIKSSLLEKSKQKFAEGQIKLLATLGHKFEELMH